MTITEQRRVDRMMPGGIPRWMRIYDNEDRSADRYTVVFSGKAAAERFKDAAGRVTAIEYPYLALSASPFHPQGVGMHGSTQIGPCDTLGEGHGRSWPPAMGRRCHLGKRIPFKSLNPACQLAAMQDYIDIWKLPKSVLTPFTRRFKKAGGAWG